MPALMSGERERALLGIIHDGGCRAAPAHGLRTTIRGGGGGGEREKALLGIIHNGGSRAAPAHEFRIAILRSA